MRGPALPSPQQPLSDAVKSIPLAGFGDRGGSRRLRPVRGRLGSKEVFRKPYERGVIRQGRFCPFARVYRKRLGTVWDAEGPFLLH